MVQYEKCNGTLAREVEKYKQELKRQEEEHNKLTLKCTEFEY